MKAYKMEVKFKVTGGNLLRFPVEIRNYIK